MGSIEKTDNTAIAPHSLVLVTGANGFIASHVADQLLAAGYRVRGTVRDTAKAHWINELFEQRHGKGVFDTVLVEDMAQEGAFDEAVKGVSGVAHVASVLTFSSDPNAVIPQTIAGTINVLASAAKEASVKRVVYTSSSTAAVTPLPNVEFSVDETTWNESAVKAAWEPPPYPAGHAYAVYSSSKIEAERAAWEFVRENKPNFVLNTVLPNANFGQILDPKNQSGSTASMVRDLFHGKLTAFIKGLPPQWFVDVKDDARLHVASLANPSVQNERIFAFAAPYNWNDLLAVMRRLYPDRTFIEDLPDLGRDLCKVPNARGAELLKEFGQPGWTSLEASVKENTQGL